MTLDCILPAEPLPLDLIDPPVAALRARHADLRPVFYARRRDLGHYARILPGSTIRAVETLPSFGEGLVAALTMRPWPQGIDFVPAHDRPLPELAGEGRRVSLVNMHGYALDGRIENGAVRLGGEAAVRAGARDFDAHAFGRLGPLGRDDLDLYSFTYFPYGYLMRNVGAGSVDPFGFRTRHDPVALASRPEHHRLIAMFGGSAAFSIYCPDDRTFCRVLEDALNARAERSGRNDRFTVLNFGVPGHVVLNQILTWLLFAQRLRPDVVIAHDGCNDVHYGLIGDPMLLADHAITYQEGLEEWSRLLHGSGDRPTSQSPFAGTGRCRNLNASVDVARAYIGRKRQFKMLAEAAGSRFVWGLQPIFASKAALSPREILGAAGYRQQYYRDQAEALPQIYDMLSAKVAHADGDLVVDLHRAFSAYGAERTLFADHVHLLPAGDAIVAGCYLDALASAFGLPSQDSP